MSRSRSKDTGFSLFRIGVIAAVLGGLFIVGGFILFSIEQQGQRQPLEIEPPAGAELRDQQGGSSRRTTWYVVPATDTDTIVAYYNQKLREFYGNEWSAAEQCKRFPGTGEFENYEAGTGTVPFTFKCLFDSSSFQADRFTEVEIQPGVRNDATGDNLEGSVVLVYSQLWLP